MAIKEFTMADLEDAFAVNRPSHVVLRTPHGRIVVQETMLRRKPGQKPKAKPVPKSCRILATVHGHTRRDVLREARMRYELPF